MEIGSISLSSHLKGAMVACNLCFKDIPDNTQEKVEHLSQCIISTCNQNGIQYPLEQDNKTRKKRKIDDAEPEPVEQHVFEQEEMITILYHASQHLKSWDLFLVALANSTLFGMLKSRIVSEFKFNAMRKKCLEIYDTMENAMCSHFLPFGLPKSVTYLQIKSTIFSHETLESLSNLKTLNIPYDLLLDQESANFTPLLSFATQITSLEINSKDGDFDVMLPSLIPDNITSLCFISPESEPENENPFYLLPERILPLSLVSLEGVHTYDYDFSVFTQLKTLKLLIMPQEEENERVIFPNSLEELNIEDDNGGIPIAIPNTLKKLFIIKSSISDFSSFHYLVELETDLIITAFPPQLQRLTFGDNFNSKIKFHNCPSSLSFLSVGTFYRRTIDNIPSHISHLRLGSCFLDKILPIQNAPTNLTISSAVFDFAHFAKISSPNVHISADHFVNQSLPPKNFTSYSRYSEPGVVYFPRFISSGCCWIPQKALFNITPLNLFVQNPVHELF